MDEHYNVSQVKKRTDKIEGECVDISRAEKVGNKHDNVGLRREVDEDEIRRVVQILIEPMGMDTINGFKGKIREPLKELVQNISPTDSVGKIGKKVMLKTDGRG